MSEEKRYYSGISAIKELGSEVNVNEHLKAGWEILGIKETTTTTVEGNTRLVHTAIVYIMGMKEGGAPVKQDMPPQATPQATPPPQSIPSTSKDIAVERLKNLPFRQSSFDKTGTIFSLGPDDVPVEVKKFLEIQKGSTFYDSKYKYRLSTKGWINRYRVE